MPFAVYDYTSLPVIHIYMSNTIESDADFNNFISEWHLIYSRRQPFIYVFHAEKVGFVPVKYALRMSVFMKNLRELSEQYLQKSIIVIDHNYAKYLLHLIFYLQPPVADVYVTKDPSLIEELLENDYRIEDSDDYEYISPGKPPFPFL
jgi:hypothetical protein